MAPFQFIGGLLQQATQQGSRSTVLRPLGWLAAICMTGLLGGVQAKAPPWILALLACFAGLTVLCYLGSYVYCLRIDRECLRSETYSIQRMKIDRGLIGDSVTGVIDVRKSPRNKLIGQEVHPTNGEEQ
jgi:hypothetical protein